VTVRRRRRPEARLRIDGALFRVPATAGLRRAAAGILLGGLRAADPRRAIERVLRVRGGAVVVDGQRYPLARGARLTVVGAGKAAALMAQAAEDILEDRITAGVVAVPTGYAASLRRIRLREAGHPLPTEAGAAAAEQILALLRGLRPQDLVICLLSGGGSALLPLPQAGLALADMVRTTDLLLRSGADITEINTVRKHLSRIAGGQLARAAAPARLVTLIISDIVGSPLDAIASGPTVPDPTTYADALSVLDKYRLTREAPPAVAAALRRGAAGELPDTPKPGDPIFARARAVVLADNAAAARAARESAAKSGFRTLLLSTFIEGEAREVGRVLAAIAREVSSTGSPVSRPACIVAGGETTVTVTGSGRGGRNQEVALAAARPLHGISDVLLVSFATDGTDGPTDAAGAVADGTTLARARARGLDPVRHLAENDAYPVLEAVGDLIRTGPTHTNVNDLMLILCGRVPGASRG
jgi:glycerate 2-kinase